MGHCLCVLRSGGWFHGSPGMYILFSGELRDEACGPPPSVKWGCLGTYEVDLTQCRGMGLGILSVHARSPSMCVQADIVWGAKLCVTGCVRERSSGIHLDVGF